MALKICNCFGSRLNQSLYACVLARLVVAPHCLVQPGGEPTAVANHEMDMVAKLQARQDRIHDAQIAQRKAEQELEADLVAEATDAAGDDVGAFGQVSAAAEYRKAANVNLFIQKARAHHHH